MPPSAAQKTCFVISPIGPEDSQVRSEANDFLELLVEPALEKYGFLVTRADQIAHPTAITTDIIRLVQEADLCLVDLTNSNPNVFYECGRRHETGRPFIQLIRRGLEQTLPFDVAGIRTVIYDVSSPRSARESVLKLQDFIDSIVSAGFKSNTGGETLSSIAQGIERVERKLNQIISTSSSAFQTGEYIADLQELQMSPPDAFYNALRKGQTERAYFLLDRVMQMPGHGSRLNYITCLRWIATVGYGKAFERLDAELQNVLNNPDATTELDDLIRILSEGARLYFVNTGQFTEGITYLESIYRKIIGITKVKDETKGDAANRVFLVAYQDNIYDVAITFAKSAIALYKDATYYLNLSLAYRDSGKQQEYIDTLRAMAALPQLTEDQRKFLKENGM